MIIMWDMKKDVVIKSLEIKSKSCSHWNALEKCLKNPQSRSQRPSSTIVKNQSPKVSTDLERKSNHLDFSGPKETLGWMDAINPSHKAQVELKAQKPS